MIAREDEENGMSRDEKEDLFGFIMMGFLREKRGWGFLLEGRIAECPFIHQQE